MSIELQASANARAYSASGLKPPALSRGEWFVLLLGCACCVAVCFLFSYHRIFWADEILGWMVATDPSFRHMLYAWSQGADGGGIGYYVLARAWMHIFGFSAVAYRAFSTFCFAAAFGITWLALRRRYSAWAIAIAMYFLWLGSPTLPILLGEGRFYGLFLLSASLAVYAYMCAVESAGVGASLLLFTFAANLLLCSSHIFGVVYSGFILAALILHDLLQKTARYRLYLSMALGWAILIPSRQAIRSTTNVGKPYFWISKPYAHDFIDALAEKNRSLEIFVVVLLFLLCWAAISVRKPKIAVDSALLEKLARHPRLAAWLLCLSLLSLPCLFFVVSRFGHPFFLARYVLPSMIGSAIFVAECSTLVAAAYGWEHRLRRDGRLTTWFVPGMSVWALVVLSFGAYKWTHISRADYTQTVAAMLPKGIPIVCMSQREFVEVEFRRYAAGTDLVYLLDWNSALNRHSERGAVTGYHLMENWRRVGYFPGTVLPWNKFLHTHSYFLVMDDGAEHWFDRRIRNNRNFISTVYAVIPMNVPISSPTVPSRDTVWAVRRRDVPPFIMETRPISRSQKQQRSIEAGRGTGQSPERRANIPGGWPVGP